MNQDNFKRMVLSSAQKAAVATLGSAEGLKAAARVTLAFAQAAAVARDPSALYRCSQESIIACITTAMDTQIYPGGVYPKAYLVPRGGQLQYEITHRGIAVLAQRAGYGIRAVPVQKGEHVLISFGEVQEHEQDPDNYPTKLDDLRGVYVILTRLADGANMGRAWVPVSLIQKRANSRQAGPVWKQWPIEMAQKTAIKYCVARGALVIDSEALDVGLSGGEVIDQELEPATVSQALGKQGADPAQIEPPNPLDDLPIASTGEEGKGEPVVLEAQSADDNGDEAPL